MMVEISLYRQGDCIFPTRIARAGKWRFRCRWLLLLDFFPKARKISDMSYMLHSDSREAMKLFNKVAGPFAVQLLITAFSSVCHSGLVSFATRLSVLDMGWEMLVVCTLGLAPWKVLPADPIVTFSWDLSLFLLTFSALTMAGLLEGTDKCGEFSRLLMHSGWRPAWKSLFRLKPVISDLLTESFEIWRLLASTMQQILIGGSTRRDRPIAHTLSRWRSGIVLKSADCSSIHWAECSDNTVVGKHYTESRSLCRLNSSESGWDLTAWTCACFLLSANFSIPKSLKTSLCSQIHGWSWPKCIAESVIARRHHLRRARAPLNDLRSTTQHQTLNQNPLQWASNRHW